MKKNIRWDVVIWTIGFIAVIVGSVVSIAYQGDGGIGHEIRYEWRTVEQFLNDYPEETENLKAFEKKVLDYLKNYSNEKTIVFLGEEDYYFQVDADVVYNDISLDVVVSNKDVVSVTYMLNDEYDRNKGVRINDDYMKAFSEIMNVDVADVKGAFIRLIENNESDIFTYYDDVGEWEISIGAHGQESYYTIKKNLD